MMEQEITCTVLRRLMITTARVSTLVVAHLVFALTWFDFTESTAGQSDAISGAILLPTTKDEHVTQCLRPFPIETLDPLGEGRNSGTRAADLHIDYFRWEQSCWAAVNSDPSNAELRWQLIRLIVHRSGKLEPEQVSEFKQLLTPVANSGDVRAARAMGTLFELDRTDPDAIAAATDWYERAAQAGDRYAQFRLLDLYSESDPARRDTVRARYWAKRLHDETGSPIAAAVLGSLIYRGEGGPVDRIGGIALMEIAADNGSNEWRLAVATIYLANGGTPEQLERAVRYLRAASDEGFEPAQLQLARLLLCGEHVPRDLDAARALYRHVGEDLNDYLDDGFEPTICAQQ